MSLAVIATDKRWYHIDVYERRGSDLVKVGVKGPFQALPEDAKKILTQTYAENTMRVVNGYVWNAAQEGWQAWQP